MIASRAMNARIPILCIAGQTASGKTKRSVAEALAHGGEIISVDSRQVYSGLDIGTEKASPSERGGIPHYLIDIRNPEESYSAADFVHDAMNCIQDIRSRGKLPILAGGTHFYFDALLKGLPADVPEDAELRALLDPISTEELYERVRADDPQRAKDLDPQNRRRVIRAIEIIKARGVVPRRRPARSAALLAPKWIILDTQKEVLRTRIDERLKNAFSRGLINEVRSVRERVGDARLNELGLEYRIIGEYLRGERTEESLFPALSAKLWQYARHQKAWLRKLTCE